MAKMSNGTQHVRVIDSHTEGEPTRVVIEGGPELTGVTLADRAKEIREKYDGFRSGVVCEPRGADAVVGALLVPPHDPTADFGVIFFNNVSTLGMCGHGTIGLVRTLQHLGKVLPGPVRIDTPVGVVSAILHEDGSVSVQNVASYRYQTEVVVDVPGIGPVTGDIAYGGNWFFLTYDVPHPIDFAHITPLTNYAVAIREALDDQKITGADGALIDHIELFGPAGDPNHHSRNYVLCPGLAYDRSPCGTGTSAKLACLYAAGKVGLNEPYYQESVIGSWFTGKVIAAEGNQISPEITGRAYITADSTLIFDPEDPFARGIVG